jgi:putative membrane protein
VWVATQVVPGVFADNLIGLAIMAIVLGLVNAIIRPILVILTLPLTVITLGLFYFVVNGIAFNLAPRSRRRSTWTPSGTASSPASW